MDDAFEQVGRLFEELCDLEPSEQRRRLDGIESAELRSRVSDLLAGDRGADERLDRLAVDFVSTNALCRSPEELDRETDGLFERLSGRHGFSDRYRKLGEIARGGMSTVMEVWDEDLQRALAMKIARVEGVRGDAENRASVLRRFVQESRLTSQLDHPGIVPVHDLGLDDEGQLFFTMPLVGGMDFGQAIAAIRRGDRAWTLVRGLGVVLRACEAVAFAHDRGVLHRDLKPANIMVGEFGEVYVVDWGLAKAIEGLVPEPSADEVNGAARLDTALGAVLGTPAYMPPEQARGELDRIGPQADVYAMGAILYHLLSGQEPFQAEGGGAAEVVMAVRDRPPSSLDTIAPDRPPELVAICEKAMAREPEHRYPDMSALATDLSAFLEGRVVRAYRTGALAELRKWVLRNKLAAGVSLLAAATVVALLFVSRWALEEREAGAENRRLQAIESARLERERYLEEGSLLLASDRSAEAASAFEASMSFGLDLLPEQLAGLASARGRLDDWEAVEALFDRHLELTERHAVLGLLHEDARRRTGRSSDTTSISVRFEDLKTPADFYVAGRWALDRGERQGGLASDFEEAAVFLGRAVLRADSPRALYYLELAHALAHVGDDDARMIDLLDVSHERWDVSYATEYYAGLCLRLRERYDDALPHAEKAVRLRADSEAALAQLADIQSKLGLYEASIETNRAAAARSPGNPHYPAEQGFALLELGQWDRSLAASRQALDLDPRSIQARHNAALALMGLGWNEEAEEELLAALELDPDYSEAYYDLGLVREMRGDLDGAAAAYAAAFARDPSHGRARTNLGTILMDRGELDEAARLFEEAIEAEPYIGEPYDNLARVLVMLDRVEDGIETWRRGTRAAPRFYPNFTGLAVGLQWTGKLAESEPYAREATRLAPGESHAWKTLGSILGDLSRFGDAADAFGRATELAPNDAFLHYALANQLRELRDFDGAIAAYERAIGLDASYAEAYCNLGNTLKRAGLFEDGAWALRKGHELGMQREDWPYDSGAWIEECEALATLEHALPEFLAGRVPTSIEETRLLAHLTFHEQRYTASVRFFEMLAHDGSLSYEAACAAACAADRPDHAGELPAEASRVVWRRRSLEWFSAAAAATEADYRAGLEPGSQLARQIRYWQNDPDLESVRGDALAVLTPDLGHEWRSIWAHLDELLDEVAE